MCLFTSRWNNDYNQLFGAAPKLKKKTKQNKTNKQTNKQRTEKKQGGKQVRAISIFLALKIKRLR